VTVQHVPVPREDFDRLLESAGAAVLVGGQALAFWMAHYGVNASDSPEAVVTKDVDFLGEKADVERLAAAVGGSVEFPKHMSILAGVVRKRIAPDKEYEVDILWRINGVTDTDIRRTAIEQVIGAGAKYFVMSPIECLVTRVANLHKIEDKRTPAGIWQARKAVEVARRHIEDMLSKGAEREAIRAATRILATATHTMGINAFQKYDIDVLEAVPVSHYKSKAFVERQWTLSVGRVEKVRKFGKA
jgi:hypothetical protein